MRFSGGQKKIFFLSENVFSIYQDKLFSLRLSCLPSTVENEIFIWEWFTEVSRVSLSKTYLWFVKDFNQDLQGKSFFTVKEFSFII